MTELFFSCSLQQKWQEAQDILEEEDWELGYIKDWGPADSETLVA